MISGVFDRVHLFPDRAEIIDYKSDRAADEVALHQAAEKYTSQMTIYRQALAKLTGLAESAIRCSLLFTHLGKVVEV
jgi:ATP-dependent exoDNAse (exonuclease V) beta subunit